jgi:hypothetical protein
LTYLANYFLMRDSQTSDCLSISQLSATALAETIRFNSYCARIRMLLFNFLDIPLQ